MANGFKVGQTTPSAVKFDAPIVDIESRYDFTQWTLDSRQPSDGITRVKNKVVITKFKPNYPILISNFTGEGTGDTPTRANICEYSQNFYAKSITGLTAANADGIFSGEYSEHSMIGGSRNTYGHWKGLTFLPYNTTEHSATIDGMWGNIQISAYVWETCLLDDGSQPTLGDENTMRGDYQSYNHSGWLYDKSNVRMLTNWVSFNGTINNNWQLALCIYTSYTGEHYNSETGIITLSTPIIFRIENLLGVDITTIEGYKVALGNELLYGKTKSFANTLLAHGLVNKQSGTYQYPNGNTYHPIVSSSVDGGQQYAYPIGGRYFDSTARFTIKDTTGDASLYVNGFYYLESLGWYPGAPQIAVNDTVTVYGKIVGVNNIVSVKSCNTQEHSGRIYQLNNTRSIIGNSIPAPGTAGTAGTLQEPYTVAAALARAKTLGVDQWGNGIVDDNASYITGKITAITSPFAPPYWEYDRLRLPVPTDLAGLITSAYPLKFWCKQYDDQDHPGFWAAVADIFEDFDITDSKYGNHLFANSGGNLDELTLNFDVGVGVYIDIGDIFNHSSLLETVNINIVSGTLKSLHNAFISCSSIQNVNFNQVVNISDFSGAFEGAAMTSFPDKIGTGVDWQQGKLSGMTAVINYAADGSKLTYFGAYKDLNGLTESDKFYTLVVDPNCMAAFARSSIVSINYILDMRYVAPVLNQTVDGVFYSISDANNSAFNSIFGSATSGGVLQPSNISVLYLKNLNKGNWHFDGRFENNTTAGYLANIDVATINYMLANVFDLRWNTTKADRFQNDCNSFNGWNASGGTLRSTSWEFIYGNATLTKNVTTSGTMHVIISATNCTFKVNGVTNTTGVFTLNIGTNTLSFEKNAGAESMYATLMLSNELDSDNQPKYRFMSELTQGLNSANIYIPDEIYTDNKLALIDPDALDHANECGWSLRVKISGDDYEIVNDNGSIVVNPV